MVQVLRLVRYLAITALALLGMTIALLGSAAQAAPLWLGAALLVAPIGRKIRKGLGLKRSWVNMVATGALLGAAFLLIGRWTAPTSIYKSPSVEQRLTSLYNAKLAEWPVPYISRYLDSPFGAIHVLESGAQDGPPMLLLHASGVAAWSWKYNAAALGERHHLYAVDLIGDAGRSKLKVLEHRLRTAEDQAHLYAHIMSALGVDRACVVGASEGGFIASNLARFHPERVSALVLLGPMGYAGATQSALRIMFAQMFPMKSIQDATFTWAFGSHPKVREDFREWFFLIMDGTYPAKVAPLPLSAEERQSILAPTLFVFGERDALVGDPLEASALVQDMRDVQVEVLPTGHLVAAEAPQRADDLILKFCEMHRPDEPRSWNLSAGVQTQSE